MTRNRLFLALLALIMAAGNIFAANPKREIRSTWLTTVWGIDWPSTQGSSSSKQISQKNEMISFLDQLEASNMTGTCFQVRSMGDAMYPSQYAPWSSYLSGTRGVNPGWDPLAFFVEECHKRGLEAYVWLNPYRWSTGTSWNTEFDKEWKNKNMFIAGTENPNYITFNPALPETRQLIVNVIKEILNNYAIDGILFDDYFYPSGGTTETGSAPDYSHYQASGTKLSIGDWRRENVNKMVADCYNAIKELRPDVRFGISPAGISSKSASKYGLPSPSSYGVSAGDWQYSQIYSDPLAWMNAKTIDFISPQIYWLTTSSSSPFGPLSRWWSYAAKEMGVHFYASHSVDYIGSSDTQSNWAELGKQVLFNRQYVENNACGSVYYNTSNLTAGAREYLKNNIYTTPVLSPQLTSKSGKNYGKVSNLEYNNGTLTWDATKNGNSIIRYTVYAIPSSVTIDKAKSADGDGIDVKYLQKVVYGTSYTIASDKQSNYYYIVCVFDGYGKEHEMAVVNYQEEDNNTTEPGYVIKTDKNSYDNVGSLRVESVWMRSILSDYNNITFESSGSFNRTMCVAGDFVYVSGRSENSSGAKAYLRKYNIHTGEHIEDLMLGDEASISYYPCNDVIKDSNGNVCVTNLTLNVSSTPLKLFMVNLETGELELKANITYNKGGRIDHTAVYGDVKSGNFYFFAAISSTNTILRWKYVNGVKQSEEVCTLSGVSNLGIAPRVVPVTENNLFVDGGATSLAMYSFSTGKTLESLKGSLAPTGTEANGCTYFTLARKTYVVYAFNDDETSTGNPAFTYNVVSCDAAMSSASMTLLWTLPKDGLGNVNSSTMQAPVDYAVIDNNTVRVVMYVPGCGLCAYDITDDLATAIEYIDSEKETVINVVGNNIIVNNVAQSITVYNMMGMQVAHAANVAELNIDLTSGLYIVEAIVNGKVHTEKIIIK